MRGILAHKLSSSGVSQRRIAYFLEVTQPMVSKLLKKPLTEYYSDLEKVGLPRDLVEHYANILAEIVILGDYERFTTTAYTVVNQLALRAVCNTRRNYAHLCTSGTLRDPEVEYYKSVLLSILSIRGLEKLIPEVGSNLAYAPWLPRSVSDIIGLAGRVIKVSGGVSFYGEPIYGGSRHVAKVLLIATKYNTKLKFCFNTKYSKQIRNYLLSENLRVVETGPHLSEEEFWASIEKALAENPSALCDLGGLGLEPVTYIFSENPQQLEHILKALVSKVYE